MPLAVTLTRAAVDIPLPRWPGTLEEEQAESSFEKPENSSEGGAWLPPEGLRGAHLRLTCPQ